MNNVKKKKPAGTRKKAGTDQKAKNIEMPGPVIAKRPTISPIFLNEEGVRAVYRGVHNGCIVDLFIKSSGVYRDINTPEFRALVSDLGLAGIHFPGGSQAERSRFVSGGGNGYNDGVDPTAEDFLYESKDLCVYLGIPLDLILYCHTASPAFETEVDGMISLLESAGVGSVNIAWELEANIQANETTWLAVNPQNPTAGYITKIADKLNAVAGAYPSKIHWVSSSDPEKNTPDNKDWRNRLFLTYNGKSISLAQGAKIYMQPNDLTWVLTSDFANNLSEVNRVIAEDYPRRIRMLKEQNPGKYVGIWQWGLLPGQVTVIHNTLLGCLFIVKSMRWFVNYNYATNDEIKYASYQNLRSLFNSNDTLKPEYYAMKAIGKMFQGTPSYIRAAFDLAGLTGWAVRNGNTFRVLVMNETGTPQVIPSVNVGNTRYTSFNRYTWYGSALDATTITEETATAEGSPTIRAYSFNVLEFTLS